MTELRLFIDADWPQHHTVARWYLCQAKGEVLRYGCSEPRHWPGVRTGNENGLEQTRSEQPRQRCSVILTGEQVACQRVRLPRGKAGRQPAILAAALEDRLLAEPDEVVLLPGTEGEDGTTPIFILGRERLRTILHLLGDLGLEIVSVWSDGQLFPTTSGENYGRLEKGLLKVSDGQGGVLALDVPPEPLAESLARLLPKQLSVSVALESDLRVLTPAGLDVQANQETSDRFPLASPAGAGFLVGEFSPPARPLAVLRPLKPALKTAVGFGVALIMVLVAQWGWLSYKTQQYRREAENVFRGAFPGAVVVDPALQMQRQLDERRRVTGQLASTDLLAQLAAILESSVRLQGFDYAAGRLELDVSLPKGGQDRLLGRLEAAGYQAQLKDLQSDGENIRTRISVQGGLR